MALQGNVLYFFAWKLLKIAFQLRNFTHRWLQSGHFVSKFGYFFPISEKGQGRPPPLPPLVTLLSRLLFPKRLWKWASTISFRKYKPKVVLLVLYLFNYDSSKWTFFMLNMAFDVLVLTFWVQFLLYKLEFFVSCNSIITSTSFFLLCILM